jgi:hypothetical protein
MQEELEEAQRQMLDEMGELKRRVALSPMSPTSLVIRRSPRR